MSRSAAVPRMSYVEYLELERTSEVRHEYLRGEVFAMAGGTPEHARLAANIIGQLTAALRGRPCSVFTSDARVRIEAYRLRDIPGRDGGVWPPRARGRRC